MLYIGTYHDSDNNLRLAVDSLDAVPHYCVNKLYDDMMKLKIVDGSNQAQFVEHQLDELNQSGCDLMTLSDDDVNYLFNKLKKANL
ncbi:hypothetical protein ACYATP_08235 [Lactobacillaceae bacterium Melli_B4]